MAKAAGVGEGGGYGANGMARSVPRGKGARRYTRGLGEKKGRGRPRGLLYLKEKGKKRGEGLEKRKNHSQGVAVKCGESGRLPRATAVTFKSEVGRGEKRD
ncbi:hypothetical protein B296_00014685 [Ensete ventricosum]|uniref:Uncharacterized protein n=1 Tax=Ensete ventricosum TaxID=4639 RepID=A0A426ZG84_ENSVE|nr:hypothetical protein B296_00014685 [Ensete ventricosum]